MIRWLFKLIILVVLAALIFGFWLIYQDKTEEEKQQFRDGVSRTVQNVVRTGAEAAKKVVEKGQEIFRGGEKE